MKKGNSGQHFDDDILRCKEEILRLKSVVPPFGRPHKHTSSPPAAVRQEPEPVVEIAPPPVAETTRPTIDMPSESIETATESIEHTAVQTMAEDTAKTAPEFEPVPEPNFEPETLVEDNGILAALEAEAAKIDPAPTPEPEPEPEPEGESEIPEFNLAEQIMAAQRKVAGNRRKGPGTTRFEIKEVEQETPTPPTNLQPSAAPIRIVTMEAQMSPQQRVIAEIVARDINKLYQIRKVS